MPADPNIYNPLLQPPRTALDYANTYSQGVGIANQNKLQGVALRQAQEAEQERNALRGYLSGGADLTSAQGIAGGYAAAPTQFAPIAKSFQDRLTAQAVAAKDNAQAEHFNAQTTQVDAETKWKLADRHAMRLAQVQTPEDAATWIDEGIHEGSLPAAGRDGALAVIQQKGLDAWKQGALQASIPVLEKYKQDADNYRAQLQATTSRQNNADTNATSRANNAFTQSQENARSAANREAENGRAGNAMTKPFEVTGPDGAPMLVQQDRQGNVTPVPGFGPKSGASKPLTNDQANARLFATRMQEADQQLGEYAGQGVERPGNLHSMADVVGLGAATNWTQSPEQQGVEQAQRNFVNAVLRKESGAAISGSEFENARKQYFPQIGDSPEVIAQKAQNRQTAIEGMLAQVPLAQRPGKPAKRQASGVPDDIAAILAKHGGK